MRRLLDTARALRYIYPVIKRGGICFSQFGEDFLASRAISIPRNSFYVDIGAAYPVKHSNTFRLYLKGGRGITVEPNPDLAGEHRKIRPRDTCICAGISRHQQTLKYHRFETPDYNTFDEETAAKVKMKGVRALETLDVPTVTLASLLESHAGERRIDLMSIDCEGLDLEVVQSSDWSRFRPRLLIVEDHDWTFEAKSTSSLSGYMTEVGYKLVARLSYSSIFVCED
jgi:FkbM family methyltransferase